jgi:hypothetical protein
MARRYPCLSFFHSLAVFAGLLSSRDVGIPSIRDNVVNRKLEMTPV